MSDEIISTQTTHDRAETAYASNNVRLSLGEWLVVAAIAAVVLAITPGRWHALEPFSPEEDYRVPYALSEDYYHYERYSRLAASTADVLVVGDSVVWGEYVLPGETLADYLDKALGSVLRRPISSSTQRMRFPGRGFWLIMGRSYTSLAANTTPSRRLSSSRTTRNASSFTSSAPAASAGFGNPQCARHACSSQTGHTSSAHSVMTASTGRSTSSRPFEV